MSHAAIKRCDLSVGKYLDVHTSVMLVIGHIELQNGRYCPVVYLCLKFCVEIELSSVYFSDPHDQVHSLEQFR